MCALLLCVCVFVYRHSQIHKGEKIGRKIARKLDTKFFLATQCAMGKIRVNICCVVEHELLCARYDAIIEVYIKTNSVVGDLTFPVL
jgi:hypothetical protein